MQGRGKINRAETPIRGVNPPQKILQVIANPKKSDPFLSGLKEIYDKENINPNIKDNKEHREHPIKENRVKSQHTKTEIHPSPKQRFNHRHNKTYNQQYYTGKEGSNTKQSHSTEIQRISINNQRKSTEKDELFTTNFQEEYYNAKQERK